MKSRRMGKEKQNVCGYKNSCFCCCGYKNVQLICGISVEVALKIGKEVPYRFIK